jgi:hypothetical protein
MFALHNLNFAEMCRRSCARHAVAGRAAFVAFALGVLLVGASSAASAGDNFQSVRGFAIYLGVLPAEVVQGHATDHQESKMHGGAPRKRSQQHIVVAVFDALTGARIEDAVVTAKAAEPGRNVIEKRLEAMPIAGAMSYGNYFAMPAKGPYRINVRVVRPATGKTVDATFLYTLPR